MLRFSLKRLLIAVFLVASIFGGLRWLSSASSAFYFSTGYTLPFSLTVVQSEDDHGGFFGDGEFILIFDTSPDKLKRWQQSTPPFGQTFWLQGPVPLDIASHSKLESQLMSPDIYYAVQQRGPSFLPWHNGDVLAFNVKTGRVWFASWDF